MPLNVRLAEGELAAILAHSGARMAIFEGDFAPVVERLRKLLPDVERWVSIDGSVGDKAGPADLTYEEIIDRGRAERADIFSYDEMSIAELFYTSGSTGAPKGVALSHRTVYLHALSVALQCSRPETIVDLHTIPLFHANGWGRPQASTLLGSKQVMVRRFDPATVFRLIQDHKATDMSLVPTMANALVEFFGTAARPRKVRSVEPAAHDDGRRGKLARIGGAVGEGVSRLRVRGRLRIDRDLPGGHHRAMEGAVVRVRQRAMEASGHDRMGCARRGSPRGRWSMRDVPRDGTTIGEIVIQGDQVMDGYFHDPEATAAAMTGTWLHTGDMAVWDEESYVNIVDRKKEIIISGGENISSIEVEAAVNAHPAVAECAVVPAPDETWGEVPAAIVVRKPGAALDEAELKAYLKSRLSRFKLPRIIEFREEPLPKTGTGKIRKMVLKEKFWAGKDKRVQG